MPHEKSILRLLTCGSVDDGKSTLIGRILYDCGVLHDDQLKMLEAEKTPDGRPDFSCLLDGLLAEREQAITIDAAYRSFSTSKRRFLIADAPGHEQYTRNMVTAASHVDAALILIDASRFSGELLPQTKRHLYITWLLGISEVVFAVNKMDRCGYAHEVFENIKEKCLALPGFVNNRTAVPDSGTASNITCHDCLQNSFTSHSGQAGQLPAFRSAHFVPVSALQGENVCSSSGLMPWYDGPALLEVLEALEPPVAISGRFRMPVQWVARTENLRGLCGTVLTGSIAPGQSVLAQPSNQQTTVKRIITFNGELGEAVAEEAVCIELSDALDVGRGEVLTEAGHPLESADQFAARVVCFDEASLVQGRTYLFRLAASEASATITELTSVLDIGTLDEKPANELKVNDIGRIKFSLDKAVPFLPYSESRDLGGFLLIDRLSGQTVAAGMIQYALRRSHNIFWHTFEVNKRALAEQKSQKPGVFWFTGLSASGKSTLADVVAKELYALGKHVYILDGDNLRHGLNRDLGFTEADRAENIRRAGEVARLMADAGLIVLATFISPFRADRLAVRERFEPGEFTEVFVDTPIETCVRRDPKGLYKKALAGEIPNFTSISSPFEAPESPELHLDGSLGLDEMVNTVLDYMKSKY